MASWASFTSALAQWGSACSGCAGLNVVKVSALLRRSAPMMSGYVWPNSASTWRSASCCARTFSGLLKSVNGVFENGASVANEGRSAVTICGTLLRAHRPARSGSGDGQLILCRGAHVCAAPQPCSLYTAVGRGAARGLGGETLRAVIHWKDWAELWRWKEGRDERRGYVRAGAAGARWRH